jgi:hypothetical protein
VKQVYVDEDDDDNDDDDDGSGGGGGGGGDTGTVPHPLALYTPPYQQEAPRVPCPPSF